MGIRDGCERELSPRWKDDDKNGCTARSDVLTAEAIEAPTVGANCTLTEGVRHSYDDDVLVQGRCWVKRRILRRPVVTSWAAAVNRRNRSLRGVVEGQVAQAGRVGGPDMRRPALAGAAWRGSAIRHGGIRSR